MPHISSLRLLFSPLKPSSLPLYLPTKPRPFSLFTAVSPSSSPLQRRRSRPRNPLLSFRARHSGAFSDAGRNSNRRDGDNRGTRPMEDSGNEKFGFNKKRAEGRDNNSKKNLQLKVRKLNPTNTISYVQGLQRFCTEHKIKLSKIDHIFLSRVCSETAGGIPGLLLTLAGIGEVNLWGPSDLKYLVDAMKSFIPHAAMVHTKSFGADAELVDASKVTEPIVLVNDEIVKISAILLQPNYSEESAIKPGDMSVIYLCELPELMGKFDPAKAKALGLKPGPKYSELQSGKSVMSDRLNRMVHPSEVMGPSVPGPIVLLIDCPTESHVQKLLSIQYLKSYYADSTTQNPKTVNCIIHLTPASVIRSLSYQNWMKKFGSAQHIMAGHETKNVEIPILKSSARIAARLNYLCPQFFPAPGFWSLQHFTDSTPKSSLSTEGCIPDSSESTSAENLLKFTLRPYANLGLDKSIVPSAMDRSEVISQLLTDIPEVVDAAEHVRQLWHGAGNLEDSKMMIEEPRLQDNTLPSCLENIRRDDLEIVLLGTGSSQPSKYRNVTSIYVNLFAKGSLLLDCGEGTLGQLKRRYGVEGADNAVRNLRCIWISHIHADHHTGLARILALRRKLLEDTPHEPVLVVGPWQLKKFLDAYQRLEELDMQFLDCRSTTLDSWNTLEHESDVEHSSESANNSADLNKPTTNAVPTLFNQGNPMQSYWKRPGSLVDNRIIFPIMKRLKKILSEAGLEALISFPVVHCPHAYGVVLKAAERINTVGKMIPGWKIVYSGDTRPCPALVEASSEATILIHEATFEDGLAEEAIARNHSTTQEAIDVGNSAGVYRIILTHFSQRYPKIPVFDEAHMHKTCIAFDMMSVNIADLPVLPRVLPYLKLLFKDEMVADESDDVSDFLTRSDLTGGTATDNLVGLGEKMDSSRRAVESYWRSKMIDSATSDEDKVTPVYKLEEICELLRSSHVSIVKEVSQFVLKRLDHKSPIVKQKALRLIKYCVGKSGVEFRREMQRHSAAVRQLFHYKGQMDALKGDALNKAVRDTAHEAISAIFSEENNKPAPAAAPAEDVNRRIQGFGNTNFETPPEDRKSFLSEVVGMGSASIKQGLSNFAQGHSIRKNDNGSYKSPTLRKSLTMENDYTDRYEPVQLRNESHGTLKTVAGGPWGQDSRASNEETRPADSGSSFSESKTREEKLLETIVTAGGVRLQPTRDALQVFLVEAAKLDALTLSHAIESKLQSPVWQIRMKAVCVLESILRKKDDEHFFIVASYFSENIDVVMRCSESPQTSLREKANKVLSLLTGEQAGSSVGSSQKLGKAETTYVQMPDLIDTGDTDDLLGTDDSVNKPSDPNIGSTTASTPPLIDDLFGDSVGTSMSAVEDKKDDDPFADVSFHTDESREHADDLFSGMSVGDKPGANGDHVATNTSGPAIFDIFGSSSDFSQEQQNHKTDVSDLMAGMSINENVSKLTKQGSSQGVLSESIFGDSGSSVSQQVSTDALSGMLGPQAMGMNATPMFPPGSMPYNIPPAMMFNPAIHSQPINYGAMGNLLAQQQFLATMSNLQQLSNLNAQNAAGRQAAGTIGGGYSSPLPDIFQPSFPNQAPTSMMNNTKKEDTRAFDFISVRSSCSSSGSKESVLNNYTRVLDFESALLLGLMVYLLIGNRMSPKQVRTFGMFQL
ncbi:hypothetical protein Tsubulata_038276 [Turnera subulata]|uniref:ribonuclease Z n=1 Tax=Turnera subulata TaxID=218843 RepID=A0A9Q0FJB4_9ROSI|nr:hypothetical protein Tsubulata_038276 [Turnera subulata]